MNVKRVEKTANIETSKQEGLNEITPDGDGREDDPEQSPESASIGGGFGTEVSQDEGPGERDITNRTGGIMGKKS
jgi:hypothetical protein